MPTGTRVCGCPSRRCSCGYDVGRKAGRVVDKTSVKIKGRRLPIEKVAAIRAKGASAISRKLERATVSDDDEGENDINAEIPETDTALTRLPCGCANGDCKCNVCGVASVPGTVELSKVAATVKEEASTQDIGSADSEKNNPPSQVVDRRARGSNVRTCGCPARKCRCGAGGRLIAGTPRSFLMWQAHRSPGDGFNSGQSLSPVAQQMAKDGNWKREGVAHTHSSNDAFKGQETPVGRRSGLVDGPMCACGKNICSCGQNTGQVASCSSGPSEDGEKNSAEADTEVLKVEIAENQISEGAKFDEDVKQVLSPIKRKSGPRTGKRSCGCPSRSCRCGAQAPQPPALLLPPLRPRSRLPAAPAVATAAINSNGGHQPVLTQSLPALKSTSGQRTSTGLKEMRSSGANLQSTGLATSAKPAVHKQPGPGTGRRACGCPARFCRCGASGGHPVSRTKVQSKVKGKGKGPGTGRRLCGCPSRLCTCGAAALLSLPLAAPDNAGSSIQATSGEETPSGKESLEKTGEKEGLFLNTPTLEEGGKAVKKRPRSGRRTCGCSARKCLCGTKKSKTENDAVDGSIASGNEEMMLGNEKSQAVEESISIGASSERGAHAKQDIGTEGVSPKRETVVERRQRSAKRRPMNALSDVARIKARVRTQLNRMRLEKNLLDIYSRDGWQGSSREKLRPDSELARASRQVTNSKLAIRSAMEELHDISLEGAIDHKAFDGDGRINHEAIFCAKCKSSELFNENDIILCDGDCNRAFHQNCLEPPLRTSDIPPGDEGWLCPACDCKIDCINAINASTGASLPLEGCQWEEVFPDAVEEAEGGGFMVASLEDEWPSDDSKDQNYTPERRARNGSNGVESREQIDDSDASPGGNGEGNDEDASEDASEDDSEDDMSDEEEGGDEGELEGGAEGPQANGAESNEEEFSVDVSEEEGEDMDIEERERRRAVKKQNGRVLRSQGRGDLAKLEELPADWVEKVEEAEAEECLVLVGKRKRKHVDYKKLNEELFGALEEEAEEVDGEDGKDDDGDWGPSKQKRKGGNKDEPRVKEEASEKPANGKDLQAGEANCNESGSENYVKRSHIGQNGLSFRYQNFHFQIFAV